MRDSSVQRIKKSAVRNQSEKVVKNKKPRTTTGKYVGSQGKLRNVSTIHERSRKRSTENSGRTSPSHKQDLKMTLKPKRITNRHPQANKVVQHLSYRNKRTTIDTNTVSINPHSLSLLMHHHSPSGTTGDIETHRQVHNRSVGDGDEEHLTGWSVDQIVKSDLINVKHKYLIDNVALNQRPLKDSSSKETLVNLTQQAKAMIQKGQHTSFWNDNLTKKKAQAKMRKNFKSFQDIKAQKAMEISTDSIKGRGWDSDTKVNDPINNTSPKRFFSNQMSPLSAVKEQTSINESPHSRRSITGYNTVSLNGSISYTKQLENATSLEQYREHVQKKRAGPYVSNYLTRVALPSLVNVNKYETRPYAGFLDPSHSNNLPIQLNPPARLQPSPTKEVLHHKPADLSFRPRTLLENNTSSNYRSRQSLF